MSATAEARGIANAGEAAQTIENLNAIMDGLTAAVEDETAHMRAGRLREALAIEDTKVELARRYALESGRLKAAEAFVIRALPDAVADLRRRHLAFQALLQTNLTVLATAHAVSEGIIRGVSGELARKRAPSTYGASGRANAPSPKATQPLAVSRSSLTPDLLGKVAAGGAKSRGRIKQFAGMRGTTRVAPGRCVGWPPRRQMNPVVFLIWVRRECPLMTRSGNERLLVAKVTLPAPPQSEVRSRDRC